MAKTKSYQDLKNELDKIMVQLQSTNGDIDKAVELHKKGTVLVRQLQDYLKNAKNTIEITKK